MAEETKEQVIKELPTKARTALEKLDAPEIIDVMEGILAKAEGNNNNNNNNFRLFAEASERAEMMKVVERLPTDELKKVLSKQGIL